jgi:hypothetical protein
MKRALVAALLFACGPHEDYTPLIHVTPGAAARINFIHRDPTDKPTANAARVHMMKAGEELTGPGATGRSGDILLENDEVAFVIAAGNLTDAADAKQRIDELGEMDTYFGAPGNKAVYTSRTPGSLEDGTAFVEARGYTHDDPALVVRTRYTLHKNDRAILVETTIDNPTTHAVTFAALGDTAQWGAKRVLSSSAFVGAVGDKTSYALTSTDGAVESDSAGNTLERHQVDIPPGKSVAYARVFLVGPRADTSGLVAELTKTAGGEVGTLRVTLVAEGATVTLPDAVVEIDDATGHPLMDLKGDAAGHIAGELPLGRYAVRFLRGAGRAAFGKTPTVEILAGIESPVTVEVTAAQ